MQTMKQFKNYLTKCCKNKIQVQFRKVKGSKYYFSFGTDSILYDKKEGFLAIYISSENQTFSIPENWSIRNKIMKKISKSFAEDNESA